MIVNSDDSFLDVQQPRLSAAEAQLGHVGLIRRMPPGARYPLPYSVGAVEERIKAVEAAIKEAGDCKLCIIDDLARFVRNGLGKVKLADLLMAFDLLRCLAAECEVAMVVVWRLDRTSRMPARQLEQMLRSAVMAWLVGIDPYRPARRWMVALKNHFGPAREPLAFRIADNRLVWDEPSGRVPADVMAAFVRKSDRRLEREQAGQWALERLADGPVEANELFDDAEAHGFSRRTVRRALVDLGLKPRKIGNDGPWCWEIAAEVLGLRSSVLGASGGDAVDDNGQAEPSSTAKSNVLEDGQLAQEDGSRTTALTPSCLPKKQSEAIQNPKSKSQNTEVEDGQLAPERVDDGPPGGVEGEEPQDGASDKDNVVIFVLRPTVPGAEVKVEDGQLPPQSRRQTSGP